MSLTHALSTNNYGPAAIIVATSPANGTHTTLASAMSYASAGQTIFLRDSVTENVTITPGVNISAWSGGSLNVPSITGTLTMTGAGTSTLSGLRLVTNSAALISVTGSAASILNIRNCYLNCSNNTGIVFSSSSSSAEININNCNGDIGTTGITLFSHSSAGSLHFFGCRITNSGGSSTASTGSNGGLRMRYTSIFNTITTSSTCLFLSEFCEHNTSAINTVVLTHGGDNASAMRHCYTETGSASAVSISSQIFIQACVLNSANTNIVTGAGTLIYTPVHLSNDGDGNFSVTTQTIRPFGPSVRVGCTNSGAANTLTVDNASNTASSTANCAVKVAGGTAGDATHQAIVSGVTSWTWGVDNSDSDAFVIAQGTALGTNNIMRSSTAGEINYPLQPAFLVYLNTTVTDVTGDTTAYTVIYDTEVFDQNGDFDLATGTFTAPITGKYRFDGYGNLIGGTSIGANGIQIRLATSNNTFRATPQLPTNTTAGASPISALCDMDAADTAVLQLFATDSGGKVDDAVGLGGGLIRNWLSGKLEA